jgi:hypothetical protein
MLRHLTQDMSRHLSVAECGESERVKDSILSGTPERAYLDDFHDAVDAFLATEQGRAMSLAQVVQRVADARALRMTECGLLSI